MRTSGESVGRAVRWTVTAAVTVLVLSCTACFTPHCVHCKSTGINPHQRGEPPYGPGVILGRPYDYDLASSCGDVAVVDGRDFRAAHTHAPWEVPSVPALVQVRGKLTLEDHDHARFVAKQGWVYDFVDAHAVPVPTSGCQ